MTEIQEVGLHHIIGLMLKGALDNDEEGEDVFAVAQESTDLANKVLDFLKEHASDASKGVVITAVLGILADQIVSAGEYTREEAPERQISVEAVKAAIHYAQKAIHRFTHVALKDAEEEGAVLVLRRPKKNAPAAKEDAPETATDEAPAQSEGLRDAGGETAPGTSETTFGGAQASGTEG